MSKPRLALDRSELKPYLMGNSKPLLFLGSGKANPNVPSTNFVICSLSQWKQFPHAEECMMTRFANFYAYDTAEETPPEVILLHGGQTGAHTSFVRKYSATFADINLEA